MTNVSGVKTWNDNNNASGARPSSITVRLLRDGQVINSTTVTAANGWRYSFNNLPVVDETGRAYVYSISEQMVPGYAATVNGYNLTNTLIPGMPNFGINPDDPNNPNGGTSQFTTYTNGDGTEEILAYSTPLGVSKLSPMAEELEEFVDLFDYGTPLWGGLLGTGDDAPIYPYVFGFTGLAALLVLAAIELKRRKKVQ